MTNTDIIPEAVEHLVADYKSQSRLAEESYKKGFHDGTTALSAALTQSRAETAAAYERAAQEVDCGGCNGDCPMPATCCATDAAAIRALATPDQRAALAAIEAAAEARGLRKAAAIKVPLTPGIPADMMQGRRDVRNAILAAIPQGEK